MKTKTKLNVISLAFAGVVLALTFADEFHIPRLWFWILVLVEVVLFVIWLFLKEELGAETASESVKKVLAAGGLIELRRRKRKRVLWLWAIGVLAALASPLVMPAATVAKRRADWIGALVVALLVSAFAAYHLARLPNIASDEASGPAGGRGSS